MESYFPPQKPNKSDKQFSYVGALQGGDVKKTAKSDKRHFRRGVYMVKNHFLVESSYLSR